MRKCSEDLELSCDETVLIGADNASRKKYASLILDTAADERGFTTCLSASAAALRYRIKHIMKHKKRFTGALTVGLLFFLLCMSSGYAALAYGESTGAQIIYNSQNISEYSIKHITLDNDPFHTVIKCEDPEAFHQYMSSLTMSTLTRNYTFENSEKRYTVIYETPEGLMGIVLSEEIIKIIHFHNEDTLSSYYYLPEKADWELLDSILVSYPACND